MPTAPEVQPGANLRAPLIRVWHAKLERFSDESEFRTWCPTCKKGLLLVSRDGFGGALRNLDHCTLCGQGFLYEEKMLGGEAVTQVELPPGTMVVGPLDMKTRLQWTYSAV